SWAEIPGGLSARPEKSPEFRTGPKIPWAEIHGTRKSEFQQFCHKSRMALIEIADDSDIDDDERERFSFTLSAKNADAFINGQYSNKKKEKHHLKSNDSYVNN
ncbi:unnamed protein product, partial [Rotaria sp. Silwood1]